MLKRRFASCCKLAGMRFLMLALLCLPLAAGPKKAIQPADFPKGGPFSPGILTDGTLYVAGQVGRDLKTQKYPEDFEAEVKTSLDNIGLVLKEAGMTFADAVSVTVYLTDMDLFQRMNAVYVKYFPDPKPVRATVGVAKLVGTARVEISLTARK
jgi:2-iminobutanoate/2-iminopropanoate deaminase